MNWVIFLFGSGWVLFVGAGLILISIAIVSTTRWHRPLFVVIFLGWILTVLSATPWPLAVYVVLTVATFGWWVLEGRWPRRQLALRGALAALWLLAMGWELPHHWPRTVTSVRARSLLIFGDSVTAGTDDPRTITWPKLLAKRYGLSVNDRSRAGARVEAAVRFAVNEGLSARHVEASSQLVLLEIGGNDLLGETPPEKFATDLEALLRLVTSNRRTVVMFELPLPPGCNRFGEIQRRLADRYQVQLIPKWIFLNVLTTAGATEDGIHLTQRGQDLMANAVWNVIGPGPAH
jgi:acyl-CoA thioesterase-1